MTFHFRTFQAHHDCDFLYQVTLWLLAFYLSSPRQCGLLPAPVLWHYHSEGLKSQHLPVILDRKGFSMELYTISLQFSPTSKSSDFFIHYLGSLKKKKACGWNHCSAECLPSTWVLGSVSSTGFVITAILAFTGQYSFCFYFMEEFEKHWR